MILTDEERAKIAHEVGVYDDRAMTLLGVVGPFAEAIERSVMRKLREAGPAGYLVTWKGELHEYAHAHASEMPAVDQARRMGGTYAELFTIPEEQT